MQFFRCGSCGTFNRIAVIPPRGSPNCGHCHRALDIGGAPQEVTGPELMVAVRASPVPLLVDCWAAWCAPCRAVAPVVDAFARARAGRVTVLKLDTDQEGSAAADLRIQGIPTFLLFRDGREVARRSGALPGDALAHWVDATAPPR
jgi:thioredoxin 2